jgi:hypothetical protein
LSWFRRAATPPAAHPLSPPPADDGPEARKDFPELEAAREAAARCIRAKRPPADICPPYVQLVIATVCRLNAGLDLYQSGPHRDWYVDEWRETGDPRGFVQWPAAVYSAVRLVRDGQPVPLEVASRAIQWMPRCAPHAWDATGRHRAEYERIATAAGLFPPGSTLDAAGEHAAALAAQLGLQVVDLAPDPHGGRV